jgi:PEP-CTERM motif
MTWRLCATGAAAVLSLAALNPAHATNPVKNGGFEHPVKEFPHPHPATLPLGMGYQTDLTSDFGWSVTGSGALSYIIGPNSSVPGAHNFPMSPSPAGGDYYAADASPEFDNGVYLYQMINGLVPGEEYSVTFYQAGASYTKNISDSAQWQVNFGGTLDFTPDGGTTLAEVLGGTTQLSPLMNLDTSHGSPWTLVTMDFTADSTSDLLSFFATGTGAPPFALLDGVSVAAAPEPATWMMMLIGIGAAGGILRRQRRERSAHRPR